MIFTVEEMNLMLSFEHSTRSKAVVDIMATLPNIRDTDLKNACTVMATKLQNITDVRFDEIDFTVYEDEGDAE